MGDINNLSMDNTTNEGMVNNSNQPSQMEELQNKINWEINTLTDRVNVIEKQINELKTIEVSDEVRKIVVGSTEFNIEDFMTKPDIEKYREWLKIKKELEGKNEDEMDDFVDETMMKDWRNNFQEYIYENYGYEDFTELESIYPFGDFVNNYMTEEDCWTISHVKDDFLELDKKEILKRYITSKV